VSQSTLACLGRRGTQGAFPHPSWDGSEGWEEAVHMTSGVTYVTMSEVHFFFVNRGGTLTHLALRLVILGGGAGKGEAEGRYGPGRG